MTKQEKYIKLRESGCTYKEIADMFGCSYQNISQAIAKRNIAIFRGITKEQCIFDGLRKWMNDNKVSARELYRQLHDGKNGGGVSINCFYEKLKGRNRLWMDEINKIIKITGLSYEDLFSKGGNDNG